MKRFFLTMSAIALMAGQACAHAFLDEAVPRVGSTVDTPPKEIRITYTEEVEPAFSHIELFGADGQPVAVGAPAADPANHKLLIAPITAVLPPGHYEVKWNVVAVDTHHTNGHFTFDYQP